MLGKHQQLADCKVHRLVQGDRCFISCTSCYRLGLFFLSLSFLHLSLFSSLERRRRKFPDMLLISSHTVDQMVKNARAAAQFMDCVAGEGVFLRNDFQLDHLFLKSKHESMNKVVPDKLQKVPARKCFKTQCIWRTSPAHPALPHLKGTNSREVILHILILSFLWTRNLGKLYLWLFIVFLLCALTWPALKVFSISSLSLRNAESKLLFSFPLLNIANLWRDLRNKPVLHLHGYRSPGVM